MGAVPNVAFPPDTDIPNVAGAPAPLAPRSAPAPDEDFGDLLTADGPNLGLSASQTPQWGLFDDGGAPVVGADSVASFQVLSEARVPDYPLEGGDFASFNKVTAPLEGRVRLLKGGSTADRTDFINAVKAAKDALDLYTLVMPEQTYQNMNVVHYDFDRNASKGVTLLAVDVWVREIRQGASAQFSNTANPNSQDAQNIGAVQPQTPTTDQGPPLSTGAQ
jgi:hypothetical protein